jgi:DNA-binding transcriptional LysR family regulator
MAPTMSFLGLPRRTTNRPTGTIMASPRRCNVRVAVKLHRPRLAPAHVGGGWCGVAQKTDFDVADGLAAGRLETALDAVKQTDINLHVVHAAGRQLSRRAQAFSDFLTAAS